MERLDKILLMIARGIAFTCIMIFVVVIVAYNLYEEDSGKRKYLALLISTFLPFLFSILYLLKSYKIELPDVGAYGRRNPKTLFLIVIVLPMLAKFAVVNFLSKHR